MNEPARAPRGGHLLTAPIGVLALTLVLASCSGSGYAYVKDTNSSAFFKIPSRWALYDEKQILGESSLGLSPQSQQATAQAEWMVAFDANGTPSLGDILSSSSTAPTGFAFVRPLGPSERDTFSLATIRNALFDVDGTTSGTPAELLSSTDVVLPGGFHGLHVEYNVRQGSQFLTVNQVGVVDPQTSTLYMFAIGCEANCYLNNQKVIDQIASSWTVKEPR